MVSKEQIKLIEKMIIAEMIKEGTPGLSMGIVENEKLVYTASFGSSNLQKRTPVTSDTLFVLASVTKSFIGMGILKLYEMKKLDLGDPITKYLPLDDLKSSEVGKNITIHHLLSHTSGIPNISDGLNIQQLALDYGFEDPAPSVPFTSWDDIYRLVNGVADQLTDKPGSKFYYNNLGYTLLAKIISVVSSVSLSEFMKKNIFEPLEMNESDFGTEEMLKNEKLTEFYIDNKEGRQVHIRPTDRDTGDSWYGPGGLISSVPQLANYMTMLFNKGNFKGKQIISEANLNLAQTQHFIESFPYEEFFNWYGQYGQTGYGYGWVIQNNFFGTKLIHHSGSSLGASTWFATLPEKKIGVIVLCNKHPSPRMFAHAILRGMLGLDPYDNFAILKLRKIFKQLEGKYETFNGLNKLEIKNSKNNVLSITFTPDNEMLSLIPNADFGLSDNRYPFYVQSVIGAKKPIVFEKLNSGKIVLNIERNHFIKII